MFKTSREAVLKYIAYVSGNVENMSQYNCEMATHKDMAQDLLTAMDALEWKEFDAEDKGTWPPSQTNVRVWVKPRDEQANEDHGIFYRTGKMWCLDQYGTLLNKTLNWVIAWQAITPPQIEEKT